MGQQQLLFLFLAVLVVAVAVAVGVSMFNSATIQSNRDGILTDLEVILGDANAYSLRSESNGGGDGSFEGYAVPSRLAGNDNGTYAVLVEHGQRKKRRGKLTITGTSAKGFGSIQLVLDDTLDVKDISFTGQFQTP